MARENTQHKVNRYKQTRVKITYDLHTGNAIDKKELPFVMAVLGDSTGHPTEPLPRLKDRTFVEIDGNNFDNVLEGMKPHLAFNVDNKLSNDPNAQLKVNLHFKTMDDFEPENVAKQVPALKALLDLRTRLSDLRGTLQVKPELDEILLETVKNTEKLEKLKGEVGSDQPEGGSNG